MTFEEMKKKNNNMLMIKAGYMVLIVSLFVLLVILNMANTFIAILIIFTIVLGILYIKELRSMKICIDEYILKNDLLNEKKNLAKPTEISEDTLKGRNQFKALKKV